MSNKQKILIADDDPAIVRALSLRCSKLGLEVETATDGLQAILKAGRNPPNVLIVDLNMPEADGFRVCQWLLDPRRPPMDVILLTGQSSLEILDRCDALGAYYVPKSSETWDLIKSILHETLGISTDTKPGGPDLGLIDSRKFTGAPPRILIVDDDPDLLRALEQRLRKCGAEVSRASNGVDGFRIAARERPDAIVADYVMPDGGGHYLLWRLRSTPTTQHIPIVVVTGKQDCEALDYPIEREVGGRSGAIKIFRKPLDTEALIAELSRYCALRDSKAPAASVA
jgi:CheY-like chemotaxis protein